MHGLNLEALFLFWLCQLCCIAFLQLDHSASSRQLLKCLASVSRSKGSSVDDGVQNAEPSFFILLGLSLISAPVCSSNLVWEGIIGLSLEIVKSKEHHVRIV